MKFTRIIITLALIMSSSLALDMSSQKRRTSTSAYVALYTSLGFENGYKEMEGPSDPTDTPFFYYIRNIDDNGVKHGERKNETVDRFFVSNGLRFYYNNDMNLPEDFLAEFCYTRENELYSNCLIKNLDAVVFTENPDNSCFFKVKYQKRNRRIGTLEIVITNKDLNNKVKSVGLISRLKNERDFVVSNINDKKIKFQNLFNSLKSNLAEILNTYKDLHSDITEQERNYNSRKRNVEQQILQLETEKLQLEEQIKEYYAKIILINIEKTKKNAEIVKCNSDLLSLQRMIDIEKERKLSLQKEREINIQKKESEIIAKYAVIQYHFDSAHFFRIFPEKIANSPDDVKAALSDDRVKLTEENLNRAFSPVQIEFSYPDISKMHRFKRRRR
jgi:hypothetical protein